jgi:type IV secretion system protein TrbL
MGISFSYATKLSKEEGVALIRAAVERGVTFFDTAEVYGPFVSPLRRAAGSLRQSFAAGGRAVTGEEASASSSATASGSSPAGTSGPPAWARRMKRNQTIGHGGTAAGHAIRSGDHPSSGSGVDLSEE